ncbi:Hpt domain-containing protein [Salinarimonas rosea]|uniref:Hpt domain-containing protein n=1 Tax=Salinarimonas rosea TaxID=552063 RepID=UPI00041C260E|nr:Hpt domain-containing protein [Salinarimonas rosea]
MDTPLLDRAHLDAQTFGDADLAREVLGLFEGQLDRLPPLIAEAREPGARIDAAHTLKGSARGVGAFRVAACAEACEHGLRAGHEIDGERARLAEAVALTRGVIGATVVDLADGAG